MARRVLWQRRYALAIVIVVATVLALVLRPRQEDIQAAPPHTISHTNHPYDPDWPDVYLILVKKCASCHRPGTEQTVLNSYDALMAAKDAMGDRVVVPGRPEDSTLWQKVVWNATSARNSDLPHTPEMPHEHADWLTPGQLQIFHRWIRNGALEYRLPEGCSTRPLMEIDFPSAKQCKACHPKQYEEWSRSMHHYAQHSPAFEAFNLALVERTGGTIGTFCTRCHTPLGTAMGENGSLRNANRSQLSREGVTCVVCHRRSQSSYKANARLQVDPGKINDGCMFGPFDDAVLGPHAGSHASAKSNHLLTSQFCGSCHDVTNPQGLRLEEAFSEWQNSPAAKAGITCQNCHMGPVQGQPIPRHMRPLGRAAIVPGVPKEHIPLRPLSDHTFSGPDYSLLPDTEYPHKLDWMYEIDYRDWDRLTPYQQKTLKELREKNRKQLEIADRKRYELLMGAAEIKVAHPKQVATGKKIRMQVDVTSKVAGHSFPTGFTAERQLWVSVEVRDPQGNVVFASGDLDSNGDLRDEHSYDVLSGKKPADQHLLNFQNKFMALSNKGTDRSVVLSVNRHLQPVNVLRPATEASISFGRPQGFRIAKGSLPPLATIGRSYPFRCNCPGPHTVSVRLNFRHLPPTLLDHIGIPHLKHLLEVVVIDQYECVIEVE